MNAPPDFKNEPNADFTQKEVINNFHKALSTVRQQLGKTYPLFIGGKEISKDKTIPSSNPNQSSEIIGKVSQAEVEDVDAAIQAAQNAFPLWRDTLPEQRAEYLKKAANVARKRIYELASWQILEVGKQWDQAYGDIIEGIDFLEYYAQRMTHLAHPIRLGKVAGEVNLHSYEPKGVAAVIAPWNFPFAISIGMVSAAIVTGNTVVYKPSELSPIVGHHLVEIFREIDLPAGVFNYIPGYGNAIGDALVEHPAISLIAFTGSMQTGLRIIEKAAKVQSQQTHVKKVVCEMGGKNAIIIDDDADLDEAIPAVIDSAFAFQGQKCSACSRLVVHANIYDQAVNRLVKTAQALDIGSSEDPANFMGALVDPKAHEKTLYYQKIAQTEGNVLFKSAVPEGGYFAPIMIVEGIEPKHRIAQEEVFGPLLAIMKVKDFDQALAWGNSTKFALTGGLFSRSPNNLERAKKEFHVGNLYLNRSCTGAIVGRQAFGGSYMSGAGTKAGGPDYLLHFLDPRVVTENTMRRGFAPQEE